jgi:MFS family permease
LTRLKNGSEEGAYMQNILFLGLVSFFTDLSTEMVYPLIPFYLTSAFGATPAILGIIEGIAESLASLLKIFSGYLSDKFQNKKALAFSGYAAGLLYKLALLAAGSWGGVLVARGIDRFGKGMRTVPRDVLVSENADKYRMGRSFGIHKALDMAGAAIGILVTYFLLRSAFAQHDFKKVFLLSVIPGALGLCMFFFIRETKTPRPRREKISFRAGLQKTDGQLKLYLVVAGLFTLGNSSNSFLLLKAKAAGFSDSNVILLYFLFNITASALSAPLGGLSDKIGRKKLLVAGYGVFAACYFGFAAAGSQPQMAAVFILYGAHTAIISGVERAFVAEISPPHLKGTMLGLHSTVTGIALLPASIIAGVLWSRFGSAVPFFFGAALALLAAGILLVFMKNAPALPPRRPQIT